MNPNLLFLIGAVAIAVLGSYIVRVITRPRVRSFGPNETQRALRSLSRHRPRRVHGLDGVRLIGRDDAVEESTSGPD